MIKRILYLYILIMCPGLAFAQINTDRVMAIGRNALYFEDYVLSIQYFNQVVNARFCHALTTPVHPHTQHKLPPYRFPVRRQLFITSF